MENYNKKGWFEMNEMYLAYIMEVNEDLKENMIQSLEFIEWKGGEEGG